MKRITRSSKANPSGSSKCSKKMSAVSKRRAATSKKRKSDAQNKSPAKKHCPVQNSLHKVQRRMFKDRLGDAFCWLCHREADEFYCPDCPRVYHDDCLKKSKRNLGDPVCECKWTSVDGIRDHTGMSTDIKELLCFALRNVMENKKKKKLQTDSTESWKLFEVWPDLKENKLLCERVDIRAILDRMHLFSYKNTGQFFQDIKWIYHNSYIVKGAEHKMTAAALKFEKDLKLQLSDMEACEECYREKHVQYPDVDFFAKVCSNPHPIVWAKLKGFPFWPAKCLRIVNSNADVRFFGTHDKSLVSLSQVYKISRQNPGGNPKKPRKTSRTASYEEAMAELSLYISNYENQIGSFQYYSKKTPIDPKKKSGKRASKNKNQSQLHVSVGSDVRANNAETSHVSGYSDSSLNQNLPHLNISLLHNDIAETKTGVLRNSSVVLENLTDRRHDDLVQTTLESNVVCHMTFDEECSNNTSDEVLTGSSTSQLPVISGQVSATSVEGSSKLCFSGPYYQPLINNSETNQISSNNSISLNPSDNSFAMHSVPSPLITSTQSLSNVISDTVGEITKLNDALGSSNGNIQKIMESFVNQQGSPSVLPKDDDDDDEIQLIHEHTRKSLVENVFKSQSMLKTFCELLLSNKPTVRNYIASFQNMALQFYLAMWLEANASRLDADECKMFHSFCEKLFKSIEIQKKQAAKLKQENEELKRKLEDVKFKCLGKAELRNRIIKAQAHQNDKAISDVKAELRRAYDEAERKETFYHSKMAQNEKVLEECQKDANEWRSRCENVEARMEELQVVMKELAELDDCCNHQEFSTEKDKKIEDLKKQMEIVVFNKNADDIEKEFEELETEKEKDIDIPTQVQEQ